jgi:outer membrane protein assembly factor BamB
MDLPGVVGQPVVVGSAVFVVANDPAQFGGARVYSFNVNSGLPIWGPVLFPAMNGPVTLAHENGRVFVLNDLGVVWALDAGTGREIWKLDLDPDQEQPLYSNVIAGGGRVYAPSNENRIRVARWIERSSAVGHRRPGGAGRHTRGRVEQ